MAILGIILSCSSASEIKPDISKNLVSPKIKDLYIEKILNSYITHNERHPLKRKVYQIFVSECSDTTEVLIRTIFCRSRFYKRFPTNYILVNGKIVFVYSALDKIFLPDSTVLINSGFNVNYNLINDMNPDGSLNQDSLLDYAFAGVRIREIEDRYLVDTLLEMNMDYKQIETIKFFSK